MSANTPIFIHSKLANQYQFHQEHPFHPIRYDLTLSLLREIHALEPQAIVEPSSPTRLSLEDCLRLAHRTDYIQMIQSLSQDHPTPNNLTIAGQYGIDPDDTPYFNNMHEAASGIVKGTIEAIEAVMSGQVEHAYHMAGGLHHAFEDRAAGFCIYNDAVIAIRYAQEHYRMKVLYIDTDVHHGDGVQFSFYADPTVCTYSIHETGKFLFPGTGFHYEKGLDQGYGACFNMPLEPYTEDDSWLESFEHTLSKVIDHFKPDLILSQHGCDAHAYDPLSHIHCSMRIYREIPRIIHQYAHQYTNGKWVAIGGGGYDLWRVVPRAWSLVWLEMIGHPILDQIDQNPNLPLPEAWIQYWRDRTEKELPSTWLDREQDIERIPRRDEITTKNRQIATLVVQDI